jgi:aspartyl-tRNA(Asn)/glutamyl-tRNA(Gln) amidotransferase subunit A
VLAKSIEDCALVLEKTAGYDPKDGTSSKEKIEGYSLGLASDEKYRVAYLNEINNAEGLSEDIKLVIDSSLAALSAKGHHVEGVSFPYLNYLLPTYYILTSAEASANLSRFDGARYGYRHANIEKLEQMYKHSRTNGFGPEVLRRIILGTFVLSSSYHDAFYTKAQRVRQMIRQFTLGVLENYDFIVMPTTPTGAFELASKTNDPVQMYLSDVFTVQASVSGIPAISIPKGKDRIGMPLSIQAMAGAFEEHKLLQFSKVLEEL